MDPFSITVGVVGILDASSKVIGFCSTYISAIRDAPNDVRIIKTEVEALQAITRMLDIPTSAPVSALRSLQGPEGTLQACADALQKLLCLLQNDGSADERPASRFRLRSRLRTTVESLYKRSTNEATLDPNLNVLAWPRKQKLAFELLEEISRYKVTIGLALSADARLSTQAIPAQVKIRHGSDTAEVKSAFLTSLGAPFGETMQKHASVSSLRCPGTCLWLLDTPEFRSWRNGGDILCISGPVGNGKTTLVSTIVQQLQLETSNETSEVLFFYFDHSQFNLRTAQGLASTLVSQLLKTIDIDLLQVESWIGREGLLLLDSHQPLPFYLIEQSLMEIMRTAFRGRPQHLVVDAVDESDDPKLVMSLLKKLLASCNVKILYTSRSKIQLQPRFARLSGSHEFRTQEVVITPDLTSADLRLFTADAIDQSIVAEELVFQDPSLRSDIIETLVDKSDGMFQWVSFHLRGLPTFSTDREIRGALDRLPVGLDDTYHAMIQRLTTQPAHQIETVRRLLQWIAFAVRPLTLAELCVAVALDEQFEDIDASSIVSNPFNLLSMSGNLLIYDESDNTVMFAHHTIREYLITGPGRDTVFGLAQDNSHTIMAKACLRYLQYPSIALEMSKLKYGSFKVGQIYEGCLALLHYAAKLWIWHAKLASKEDEELCALLVKFFYLRTEGFDSWQELFETPFWDNASSMKRAAHLRQYADLQNSQGKARGISAPSPFRSPGLGHSDGNTIASVVSVEKPDDVSIDESQVIFALHSTPYRPLHYLARLGFANCVKSANDQNIGSPGGGLGMTPLHEAARAGQVHMLDAMLPHWDPPAMKQILDMQDSLGRTALFHAAQVGHFEMVGSLLDHGADWNIADWYQQTPLLVAERGGFEKVVSKLSELPQAPVAIPILGPLQTRRREETPDSPQGLDLSFDFPEEQDDLVPELLFDRKLMPDKPKVTKHLGTQLLRQLATRVPSSNKVPPGVIEFLVGDSIHRVDSRGRTVLHQLCTRALNEKRIESIEWLLANGGDVRQEDKTGHIALHYLISNPTCFSASLLYDNSTVSRFRNNILPVLAGVPNSYIGPAKAAHVLIETFFASEHFDSDEPISIEPLRDAMDMLGIMLKEMYPGGKGLSWKNDLGETPLALALRLYAMSNCEGIEWILPEFAEYLSTRNRGVQTLPYISGPKTIRGILTCQQRVEDNDDHSHQYSTPSHRPQVEASRVFSYLSLSPPQAALALGLVEDPSALDKLLEAGLDPNAADTYGDTALHLQIERKGETEDRVAMVRALVRAGANSDVKNKNGRTPLNLLERQRPDEETFNVLARALQGGGVPKEARWHVPVNRGPSPPSSPPRPSGRNSPPTSPRPPMTSSSSILDDSSRDMEVDRKWIDDTFRAW